MFTSRSSRRTFRSGAESLLAIVATAGLLAGTAIAQDAPAPAPAQAASPTPAAAPPPAPAPSLVELKAAAYDAQEAARQAKAHAEQASAAAEAAKQAVGQVTGVAAGAGAGAAAAAAATPEPVPVPVEPAVPAAATATDPTLDELHRATEEAKNAAASARAATAALAEHIREREARYSRNGFFISGGVFYAPELFDTSLSVGDSRGAFGAVGYHFAERLEVEVRFDAIDDFLLYSPRGFSGSFSGWSTTANFRIFILTKSFQPYVGIGLGAMQGDTSFTDLATGQVVGYRDTVPIFRVSGGFDFYLTEALALTADASVNLPGGELNSANYATLGGGIKLRF